MIFSPPSTPYSLYLHIPFCKHRCAYCDFNTYAGQDDAIPEYVDALCNEIKYVGQSAERSPERGAKGVVEAHTIFFGGGTPSLLTPAQFKKIFTAIRQNFTVTSDAEITIEANPGTIAENDLSKLRDLGINRISYGVQSANTEELRMLERIHDFFTVIEAVAAARQAGFTNLNLDLIYGLPEQTLTSWQTTVKRVVDLHPEHISAYALTLEHGTPFGRWSKRGLLPIPDPDLAAEMYEWADEFLAASGYEQYEISNWAKSNSEFKIQNSEFICHHNLQYWRNLNYLGFGAGAHGYAHGIRYSNVLRIKTYIERATTFDLRHSTVEFPLSPATVNHHRNTLKEDMQETLMTGLRLTREGVSASEFESRFGAELLEVFGKEIDELVGLGLLEWTDPPLPSRERGAGVRVKLTPRGRLLGNQVFMQFVG